MDSCFRCNIEGSGFIDKKEKHISSSWFDFFKETRLISYDCLCKLTRVNQEDANEIYPCLSLVRI